MALRNLVEGGGDCGGSNALVRAVDQFSRPIKFDQRELLHHQQSQLHQGAVGGIPPSLVGDGVFRMDALLSDLERVQQQQQRLSHPQLLKSPTFVQPQLADHRQWVNEFSSSNKRPSLLVGQSFSQTNHGTSSSSAIVGNHVGQFPGPSSFMPPPPLMHPMFIHHRHNILNVQQQHQQQESSLITDLQLPQPFLQEQERKLAEQKQQEEIKVSGKVTTQGAQKDTTTSNTTITSDETRQAQEFVEFVEELGFAKSKDYDQSKTQEEKDDLTFWNNLAEEWDTLARENSDAYSFLGGYDSVASEPFSDGYYFKDDNPLKETPNAFEEGLKKLEEGDIPSAVLLFEAAAQQEPERVEVWQYLGTTQAKNEHDPAAIRALKRALELDPGNLTCLMALAVSYTNESYQRQACDALAQWILSNPSYSSIAKEVGVQPSFQRQSSGSSTGSDHPFIVSSVVSSNFFNQVKEAYIKSARLLPSNLDPDVQCGLGVLFNLSGEYDKAVDCFKAALSARPDDALLWNRLGATLANGSRSEEAVSAYTRALELSPGFIRSRFNLGISCINLNAYQEAVEHFLVVLNLQNAGRGPKGETSRTAMSNNVWSSLRMALSLLNRQDLYDSVEAKDLPRLNREFGVDSFDPRATIVE